MSSVDDFAEHYLRELLELDPSLAAELGMSTDPSKLTDYSPEGFEARAELTRATLRWLEAVPAEERRDRVAAECMRSRLQIEHDVDEAGERLREVNPLFSPLTSTRSVFDLLPRETAQDWEDLAARMEAVPDALAGYQRTLRVGIDRGIVAARRQAGVSAEQATVYAGRNGDRGFFRRLQAGFDGNDSTLQRRLDAAAVAADAALGGIGTFLRATYAPACADVDAVGPDRYQLWSRYFNGATLDLDETYRWGWDELQRIRAEIATTAAEIVDGGGFAEAVEVLETDPARSIEGVEPFIAFLQQTMDEAMAALDGTHFDIPAPVKTVEAMVAPPGGAAAMYYTPPTVDFSRPGQTWYPTLGKTRFPLWTEVSTAYHEGVPGHHLHLGYTFWLGERLNVFQRLLGFISSHGEGWALYAERLMGELGYLENPDYRLGMLAAQALRAARVVVDIGMHLSKQVPDDAEAHAGETWTADLALAFLIDNVREPPDRLASEVDRYLGLPGQAIAYKVGERVWLDVRERARRAQGANFSLKEFHRAALDLGPVDLQQLERELAG